jgi:hypothetical protein
MTHAPEKMRLIVTEVMLVACFTAPQILGFYLFSRLFRM